MKNMNNSGLNIFDYRETKGKVKYQNRIVSACFFPVPKTRQQVATETGVRIQNICRFVKVLRDMEQIKVVSKGVCPITKESGVEFLTTNRELWGGGQNE